VRAFRFGFNVLIGTVREIAAQVRERREPFAPVVELLHRSGRPLIVVSRSGRAPHPASPPSV
jgi:hypothetical protein